MKNAVAFVEATENRQHTGKSDTDAGGSFKKEATKQAGWSATVLERLVAKIRRLREETKTWQQIADTLGISLWRAWHVGTSNGCRSTPSKFRTQRADSVALNAFLRRRNGAPYREIAQFLKVQNRGNAHRVVARGRRVYEKRLAAGKL